MRFFFALITFSAFLLSCDDGRVYEKNTDFESRYWLVNDKPEFEFVVTDSLATYNLYCNIRNSLEYPFARIFVTYYLRDSLGVVLEKNLVQQMLFDEKTGQPFGETGLGDLYDHRILLRQNYRFAGTGKHKISFEQYMRTDTLGGILAVGLRVEKNVAVK